MTVYLPFIIQSAPPPEGGYFVDSVAGDDDNDGRSSGAPFATVARLLQEPIANDDIINLKCGSYWREEISLNLTGITIQSYSTGNKPILDCADIITNGSFSKTAGRTNVYEVSVSPNLATPKTWVRVWEDGTNLLRADSVEDCDTTPGSYYPTSDSAAPITLYVHASDSSDVSSNAKLYEFNQRQAGINLFFSSGCTVDGIETTRNLHDNGSLVVGQNSTVRNCIARDGSKHNIYVRTGCTVEDTDAIDFYYNSFSSAFVYNENSPASEGVTFARCRAINNRAFTTSATGWLGHKNVSGSFGVATFTDCETHNFQNGFLVDDITQVDYIRCIAQDCRFGWRTDVAGITYTLTDCQVDTNVANARALYNNGASQTITIDGLAATFASAPSAGAIYIPISATVSVTNSVLDAPGRYYDINGTLTSDLNCFEVDGSFRINGTTHASLAAYQAATGQDANSTIGGC